MDSTLIIGPPRSGTTLCAACVGAHPDIAMTSEDMYHGAKNAVGVKIWGNKLCVPNHITFGPIVDDRSLLKRLEDGVRAAIGRPRRLHGATQTLPYPDPRTTTIRTYLDVHDATVFCLVREPNPTIDSHKRRSRYNPTVRRSKNRWCNGIREIHKTLSYAAESTHVIQFSDLVQSPKTVLRAISEVLRGCIQTGNGCNLLSIRWVMAHKIIARLDSEVSS